MGKEERPSPSVSATLHPVGTRRKGNDGKMWVVGETKTGVKRWTKPTAASKKPSRTASRKTSKAPSKAPSKATSKKEETKKTTGRTTSRKVSKTTGRTTSRKTSKKPAQTKSTSSDLKIKFMNSIPSAVKDPKYSFKVNLPKTLEDYEEGVGEGIWVAPLTVASHKIYRDMAATGKLKVMLLNSSLNYPELKWGAVIQVEMRGDKRPVLEKDMIIKLQSPQKPPRSKQDVVEYMRAILIAYKQGLVKQVNDTFTLWSPNKKAIELVKDDLTKRGDEFQLLEQKKIGDVEHYGMKITKLSENSYIRAALEGDYIVWMLPFLRDLV